MPTIQVDAMSNSTTLALQQQLLHDRRSAVLSGSARDPRLAPGRVSGKVSLPETCQFYGAVDAISHCRTPRSCLDCLTTPGCGITSYGQCRNTTSDANYFSGITDYRSASFLHNSSISTASSFVFLAGTATYCKASDAVCTKCRQEFEQIDLNTFRYSDSDVSTQFCKGAGGCVCIGICELPSRRADRIVDWECGQPQLHTNPLPRISRSNHSTTTRSDPRAPVVKVANASKKEETCAYTKEIDLRGCRRPRSCQDCLLKPGCMIGDATCTDMTRYEWSRDFRTAQLNASQRSYARGRLFPSSNTTYCDATDAACAACRKSFPSRTGFDWYTLVFNADFCVGQDGCVCIEACESPLRSTGVYDEECNASMYGRPESANPLSALGLAVVAWILLWVAYKASTGKLTPANQSRRGPGQSGPRMLRHMLDQAPAVVRMNLTGWRGDHDRLRAREERVLRGEDLETAPLSTGDGGECVEIDCDSPNETTEGDSSRNVSSVDLHETSTQSPSGQRTEVTRRRSTRNL